MRDSYLWQLLLVGLGGSLGSVLRFSLSGWVQKISTAELLPVGTMAVNIIGCLLFGLLTGLAETRHIIGVEGRALLLAGLLGGFTTFSTFGFETLALAQAQEVSRAMINVFVQVGVGVMAAWLGLSIARLV